MSAEEDEPGTLVGLSPDFDGIVLMVAPTRSTFVSLLTPDEADAVARQLIRFAELYRRGHRGAQSGLHTGRSAVIERGRPLILDS